MLAGYSTHLFHSSPVGQDFFLLAGDRCSVERKAEAFTHPLVNPYLLTSPYTLGRGLNSRRFGPMGPSSCKPILSRHSFICSIVQNRKMRQVLAFLTHPTDQGVACGNEMSERMMIVVCLKLKMDWETTDSIPE